MKKRNRERELKQQIKDLRRQTILNSAEKLFLTKGYGETTMQDIADEAGYGKGTLYNYFKSKDSLYLSIGIKAYELVITYTEDFIEDEEPGLDQLMAIGYGFYEFAKDHPGYARIFHDIATNVPDPSSKPTKSLNEAERDYLESSNRYRDVFMNVMKDAMRVGALRSDVNPMMIGYVLSNLTSSLIAELIEHPGFLERFKIKEKDVVEFTFEILAEGLKPRESKKEVSKNGKT